ncbi:MULTISPECIES: hypothetical protein [unclassified Rhodosalinus]|uniref:hypothetical protein n=1 Tax=unclassified Rhodosalinus TaxID=2630183 RepID=UPI00352666E8
MTLRASDIEKLLADSASSEVFIEMEDAEVEMDTGHGNLENLAKAHGYRLGDRIHQDGRSGRMFHLYPEKS